jgi:1,6-anhydro-N-acetylmuramate kinase
MTKGLRQGGITQKTLQPFQGPPMFAPYKGKSTGVVAAQPFIRPAVEQTKDEVRAIAAHLLTNVVIKNAEKAGLTVK